MLGQFVLLEFSTRFNWPAGSTMFFGLLLVSRPLGMKSSLPGPP
jgi:hypothetical protein